MPAVFSPPYDNFWRPQQIRHVLGETLGQIFFPLNFLTFDKENLNVNVRLISKIFVHWSPSLQVCMSDKSFDGYSIHIVFSLFSVQKVCMVSTKNISAVMRNILPVNPVSTSNSKFVHPAGCEEQDNENNITLYSGSWPTVKLLHWSMNINRQIKEHSLATAVLQRRFFERVLGYIVIK